MLRHIHKTYFFLFYVPQITINRVCSSFLNNVFLILYAYACTNKREQMHVKLPYNHFLFLFLFKYIRISLDTREFFRENVCSKKSHNYLTVGIYRFYVCHQKMIIFQAKGASTPCALVDHTSLSIRGTLITKNAFCSSFQGE